MKRKNVGKNRIILFLTVLLLLFVFTFTLGVIVGKKIESSKHRELKAELEKSSKESENLLHVLPERSESKNEAEIKAEAPLLSSQDKEILRGKEEKSKKSEETLSEPRPLKELTLKESKTPFVGGSEKKETSSKDMLIKEEETKPLTAKRGTDVNKKGIPVFSFDLPKTDPGGVYTVQLGSFRDRDKAYKLEKLLLLRGYPVFVKKVEIPGKGSWYRVRVGTFKDRKKASLYADILKSKEKEIKTTFVTKND